MNILQKPARAENCGDKRTEPIAYLVLHGAEGTAEEQAARLQRCAIGCGTHYYLDENACVQAVPDERVAFHCGSKRGYYELRCRNANSLGLTLCRPQGGDLRQKYADRLLERAAALVRALCDAYGIPPDHVLRHYDVTHTPCPAAFVRDREEWARFRQGLREARPENLQKSY